MLAMWWWLLWWDYDNDLQIAGCNLKMAMAEMVICQRLFGGVLRRCSVAIVSQMLIYNRTVTGCDGQVGGLWIECQTICNHRTQLVASLSSKLCAKKGICSVVSWTLCQIAKLTKMYELLGNKHPWREMQQQDTLLTIRERVKLLTLFNTLLTHLTVST